MSLICLIIRSEPDTSIT